MPDREFIHVSSDVHSALTRLFEEGFLFLVQEPQSEASPKFLEELEIRDIANSSLDVLRPEWIYGPFQTMMVTGGHNSGKFFVQRVNYACLSISFNGERIDQGKKRFGSCVVSWDRKWLQAPENNLRPSPPEVKEWFNLVIKRLSSGVVIKAGVHNYHVTPGVLVDRGVLDSLPPFDFIPWDKKLLRSCPGEDE